MSGDWQTAAWNAAGLDFRLQKDSGTAFLYAESKIMSLPERLDMRICEALEYTFFEPKPWVVRVLHEGGHLTTALRPFPKGHIRRTHRPPIGLNRHPNDQSLWNLFARYLEYILPYPISEWHPLSEKVHFAIVGDAGPLDAGLLALSVAVEGVLKVGFPSGAAPDDSLRAQIDAACGLISGSNLDDSFKARLVGAVNAMRTTRAKDKLIALQQNGMLRKGLIDAWESTRHPSVHADGLDKTEIPKIYRNYQSTLALFNELVFLVIGYVGPYRDYSVAGWPVRNFEKTMKDVDRA
jgi:hypothetical protein